jgi:hypothetical protein
MSKFVVYIDKEAYPVRLVYHKVYKNLADEEETARGWVRVVDESGEDFLFYSTLFVPVTIPVEAEPEFEGVPA